jgi:bacterioferritin
MKGNQKIIEVLNSLLARELTVVSQYMVHSEMCENWGYDKLGVMIQKRAVNEMRHAERLIGRILFLEGLPVVSQLEKIHIGADVPAMFSNDHQAEIDAVARYNDGIVICAEAKDFATQDFLKQILNDEDDHVDSIEAVMDEIKQIGLPIFLAEQLK